MSKSKLCVNRVRGGEFGDQMHTVCSSCPSGFISQLPIVDTCVECAVGKTNVHVGQNSCTVCEAGRYSDTMGDAKGCTECVGSYIVDNSTTVAKHDDVTDCDRCKAGKHFISTVQPCGDCLVGTFQQVDGTYERTIQGVQCQDCPSGWYQNQNVQPDCLDCDTGKYQKKSGNNTCVDCPAGYSTDLQKGLSACKKCQVGKQADRSGRATCDDCASGRFAKNTNQKECDPCSKGYYQDQKGEPLCDICTRGKFSEIGSARCNKCILGRISKIDGATECQNCPGEFYLLLLVLVLVVQS
jgi:hypothetical protein